MPFLEFLPSASVETSAFSRRELPQFAIGDRVAEDWEADDARGVHHSATDFGEILGVRWVPENADEIWLPQNSWIYYVNWTHSTREAGIYPPYYDGEPSMEADLRLIS